jgi:20S proteasome alpha/beta subunit
VTIGVGFQCTDGVVLCSDRQMTSDAGYKFHRQKISWSFNEPRELRFIFAFSGRPAAAAVLIRKVRNTFADEYNKLNKKNVYGVREKSIGALEKIFRDRNSKEANTLIGISIGKCPPFLLRTQGNKVLEANTEYMGSGDSSALRFICDTVIKTHLTVEKAKITGAYIISVANRFADGCSGGPDIISLTAGGIIQQASREFIRKTSEQFGQFEEMVGKEFSKLAY